MNGSPLRTRYQVVILGSGADAHGARLQEVVKDRIADLGKDVSDSLAILGPGDLDELHPQAPSVAIFLGGDTTTNASEATRLIGLTVPVLPVVGTIDKFAALVPPALHPINGFAIDWDSPDFTELVNLVLENLSLLRRTRRLFISYLRRESTSVAHQLRVALDDVGYDTFLDSSSVPKGDDFQTVLWHRLLDSDVVVVLDTPEFMSSQWTTEEVARAHAMSVGIVRVVWPATKPEPKAELAVQVDLRDADFDNDKLAPHALSRVVTVTEGLRARCISARHSNLIAERGV